jgi:hypothetical protein
MKHGWRGCGRREQVHSERPNTLAELGSSATSALRLNQFCGVTLLEQCLSEFVGAHLKRAPSE